VAQLGEGRRAAGGEGAPAGAKGEHLPDRLGQAAGDVDLGDLGAALAAQPALGGLVAVAIGRVGASIGAQRRYLGPFLDSGPRRSELPDW
jgi:hypothetical protein